MMRNIIKKLLKEEFDDFDWVKDIEPKTSYDDQSYLRNFDSEYVRKAEDVKVGDLLQKYNGHSIYKVEKIEYRDVNGILSTLLGIDLDKEVIYKVRNVITNKPSRIEFYKQVGVSYPSRRPVYRKQHLYKLILRDLNESIDEFDWIKDTSTSFEGIKFIQPNAPVKKNVIYDITRDSGLGFIDVEWDEYGRHHKARIDRDTVKNRFNNGMWVIKESEELDWVRNVELDLIPGEIYDIKTGNGYYWVPEIYVGKKWDNEHQIEMYKFKDLDGGGSGGKSTTYVKDLMDKGNIRPYDPNWSIKDELTFSENIEDALKGGFVIYFKDGVYLDQTLPIQDKLFEMGFSFYTKKPNEYITNEDSPEKIQFFESFNWDTSNPRYGKMPSDQWDKKKVLLMPVDKDKGRWRSKSDPRLEEQELFLTVRDHNVIVIDGDKYTT